MSESLPSVSMSSTSVPAVATPEMIADLSDEVLLDTVISAVFAHTKFSVIKDILDYNDIVTLTDLAMYDCDELCKMKGA